MINALLFVLGVAAGFAAYHFINVRNTKSMKDAFAALSAETMEKSAEQIMNIAEQKMKESMRMSEQKLEGKKEVIDGTLKTMRMDLKRVEDLMQELERDREKKFGELGQRLQNAAEVIHDLKTSTTGLSNALSRTHGRGQWGERMAEDVLQVMGFVEGINYTKQKKLENDTGRPDFTFLLPQQLKLHMDVKFPFDNYGLCINAKTDGEREKFKGAFLRDVRGRIKELQSRAYINPEDNTVDYVLLFIPNEQVYNFINENDRALIDEALKAKTILCSPLSLYAVLALVRQAVDSFRMESKSREVLSLIAKFKEQWLEFKEAMEKFGTKLGAANEEFITKVMGTRLRQLERPLEKIEQIRQEQGLPVATLAIEEAFEKAANENMLEALPNVSAKAQKTL